MATTYMNMTLPTVSVTLGPTWATYLNTALDVVDAHDHSSGKGTRVTPAGLNINADLEMNGNDLTQVRSVRLENHSGSLVGASDQNALYTYAGNFYYNNSSGTSIQLTSGGGLNSAGLVANVHTQEVVAGTHTILANDTYVTLKVNTAGARTINLPAVTGVTEGRYYVIQDVSGQSETNPITIVPNGSDTVDNDPTGITLSMDNGVWWLESDGVSNWKVTRPSPDFLTKSALTLGTTVLNTSYMSIGSSTAGNGVIRLPNAQYIKARTTAGGTSGLIGMGAQDQVTLGDPDGLYDVSVITLGTMHVTGTVKATNAATIANQVTAGTYITAGTYVAVGASPAGTGVLRIPYDGAIYTKNTVAADNLLIKMNSSDQVAVGGPVRYDIPGGGPTWSVLQRIPEGDFGFNNSGTWSISGYAGLLVAVNTATTAARRDFFIVNPPDGATLNSITMYYQPGGSSRTPATRLGIYAYRISNTMAHISNDATHSLISTSRTDTATVAQVAAYSFPSAYTSHTFICDQANVIDRENYTYVISIVSESGAGADGTVNSVRGFLFTYSLARVGRA